MGERGDPAVLNSEGVGLTVHRLDRFTWDRPFAYAAGMGEGEGDEGQQRARRMTQLEAGRGVRIYP